MSKLDREVDEDKQKREAVEQADAQRDVSRPKADARAWAHVNKLPGGSKKINARRKVPYGPLGGSGRKTNQSRSS
jgi:hypothetical protein